jgi:hypothetical protein
VDVASKKFRRKQGLADKRCSINCGSLGLLSAGYRGCYGRSCGFSNYYPCPKFTKRRRTLSKPWSAPVVFEIIYSQRLAFWFFLAMKKEQIIRAITTGQAALDFQRPGQARMSFDKLHRGYARYFQPGSRCASRDSRCSPGTFSARNFQHHDRLPHSSLLTQFGGSRHHVVRQASP